MIELRILNDKWIFWLDFYQYISIMMLPLSLLGYINVGPNGDCAPFYNSIAQL